MMPGTSWQDWVFSAVAGVLAVAGVVLLSWSLWWDRPRGRKRCPKCWYDMSGAAGLVCPECGKDARRERRLLKTRRRWRWGVLATVILLAGSMAPSGPRVVERGWIGAVPDWALVAVFTNAGGMRDWKYWWKHAAIASEQGCTFRPSLHNRLSSELMTRLDGREFSRWYEEALLRSCVRGDLDSPPRSEEWWERYDMVFGRLMSTMPKHRWESIDTELTCVAIRSRNAWPVGATPLFKVHCNQEVEPRKYAKFTVTSPRGEPVFEFSWDWRNEPVAASAVGSVNLWTDSLVALGSGAASGDVWSWRIVSGTSPDAAVERKAGVARPVFGRVQHASELVEAVDDESITHLVRALQPRLREWDHPLVDFGYLGKHFESIQDITVSLRIELLAEGEVVASTAAWWANENHDVNFTGPPAAVAKARTAAARIVPYGFAVEFRDAHNIPDLPEYTLRLTGDPDVALRNFNCKKYWKGQVEIPVKRWR